MAPRILVAGLGNIFLGDDGFGSEVVRRLARRTWPASVTIGDFGVRSFDLQLALQAGHDAAILVDITCRGGPPGTLYWIDTNLTPGITRATYDPHAMDPGRVLAQVASMGDLPRVQVLGCEPACIGDDAFGLPLSQAVEQAIPAALAMIEGLLKEWLTDA